jgi:GTP-binding protein
MAGGAGDIGQVAPGIYPARPVDPLLVEVGRRLFAREARFIAGAADASAFPEQDLPEVAFAGRSNVGKSSLVNALTGRRVLARTSNTPGRTRQINFFDLGGQLVLVDFPGYGYADAPKAMIQRWTGLVQRYLQSRGTLRRVCLLVDSRHGIKDADRALMHMLDDFGVSYQIVLTKTDKAVIGELKRHLVKITAEIATHSAAHPEIHLTSAIEGCGIAELHEGLGAFAVTATRSR